MGIRRQDAAVAMFVDSGRSHQVRQTLQQLQRGEDQLGAAIDRGFAQVGTGRGLVRRMGGGLRRLWIRVFIGHCPLLVFLIFCTGSNVGYC